MPSPDPIEVMITGMRFASDQQMGFYREHLKGVLEAYRKEAPKYDHDAFMQLMVKGLMESDNTREHLCYQLAVAIEALARRPT
jgi:hypothetical protein